MPRYAASSFLLHLSALLGCALAQAKGLDSTEQRIIRAADARQAQSLELLAEVVNIPSATENHAGVRKSAGSTNAPTSAGRATSSQYTAAPAASGRS